MGVVCVCGGRGGSNLGDAVETLHVAVVDEEVKVSLGGGGEGGMPHHLTVQLAVGVHHTWGGGVGGAPSQ